MDTPTARRFGGVYVPIQRSNQGLANDRGYIQSGVDQARQLHDLCGGLQDADLLDFGCGQGRLATALIVAHLRPASYLGIDTAARSVAWCREFIAERVAPDFKFENLPAYNERYNSTAVGRPVLPVADHSKDIAFVNSVFTHMRSNDVSFYAAELARILRSTGLAYLTAFVEDRVANEAVNPAGYLEHLGESSGPLHRVRFERRFLTGILSNAGLRIEECRHRGIERTGQTIIIARPT